eukprot:TRINITY_DN1489_c0_g1_i1.p1 TRINITY_DN1489_c0_g1~~TRINITY_DN1489_c0_g1_i1.p1  ORF type:complete len:1387 (-),score=354.22 TRINITY_DN1489_c0_g1_i1:3213-7373(-)
MTAPVTFNNMTYDGIFDTGASLSCIGINYIKEMMEKDKNIYINYNDKEYLNTISGGSSTIGTTYLNTTILDKIINYKFNIIAADKILIGMDLMALLHVKIDTNRRIIKTGRGKHQIMYVKSKKNTAQKLKIRSKEEVDIIARSVMCINVVVDDKNVSALLVEPVNEFCPRSIIKMQDGVGVLCIVNPTDKNIKLSKNEILGHANNDFEYVDTIDNGSGKHHFVDKKFREVNNIEKENNNNNDNNTNSNNLPISDDEIKAKISNKINNNNYLSRKEKDELNKLLNEYQDIFNDKLIKGGMVDKFPCNIKPVEGTQPIFSRRNNYSDKETNDINKEVEELKKNEVIEDSVSPWESPVVIIKKSDGTSRFCIDFRRINKVIEKDVFPLPNIDLVIRSFIGCKYFSKVDFTSGFFQIKIDEKDRKYTAFATKRGKYQFRCLPQGFVNSSSIFQRTMNLILAGLGWEYLVVYVDDILVFSKSFEDHLLHLRNLFNKLREYKLVVKISKCEFARKEILFLGHLINKDGIKTDPKKCAVILKSPNPTDLGQVRSFLGGVGYYRKFIKNFSDLSKPLRDLANGNKWYWGEAEQQSYDILKQSLASAPVLIHPDPTKPFRVLCDASGYAAGIVLEQDNHPVYFYSQSFNKTEQKYGTSERECLAMVLAIKKFRTYLYGNPFTVVTDHSSLRYLFENRDHVGRLMRWSLMLQEYAGDMTIEYRPGKVHCAPDACSRYPIASNLLKLNDWFKIHDSDKKEIFIDDSDDEYDNVANEVFGIDVLDEKSDFMGTYRDEEYHRRMEEENKMQEEEDDISEKELIGKLISKKNGGTLDEVEEDEELEKEEWEEREIIELSEFGKIQKQDEIAGKIMDYLIYGKSPVDEDAEIKRYVKECLIEEGKLYKVDYKLREPKQCLWIPESKVENIIEEFHGSLLGGHCGFERTLAKISERYFFPLMYSRVKNYVLTCIDCQRKKPYRQKEFGKLNPLKHPSYPFERMSMDIVGPMTETKNGNKYIVTFMDYFSRWPEAIAMKEVTTENIAQVYLDKIICRYGCPRILLTDRGSQFTSKLFNQVNKLLKTKHRTTTAYHPQTNGVIEKFHESLVGAIKFLCASNEENWDEYIDVSLFIFRTTNNKTIGKTPFEALYGFKASLPADIELGVIKKTENLEEWTIQLRIMRKKLTKFVEEFQEKKVDKDKKKYADFKFDIGDPVFSKNETVRTGKTKKFSNPNSGPHIIKEQTSANNFTIRHGLTGKISKVHVSKLRKAHLTPKDLKYYQDRIKDFEKQDEVKRKLNKKKKNKGKEKEDKEDKEEEESGDFEVEEILDHRNVPGEGDYYLIKWLEYGNEANEWSHVSNLNCDNLLEEYLDKEKNKKKKTNFKFKDKKEQRRWDRRKREEE